MLAVAGGRRHWVPACQGSGQVVVRQRSIRGGWAFSGTLARPTTGSTSCGMDGRSGRESGPVFLAGRRSQRTGVSDRRSPESRPDRRRDPLDHCRVTYTKDRFDRADPAWEDMIKVVRGEGPLRPDKAADLGFGNASPLYKLFQVFRRSTPKPKVAGCYAKFLVVPNNERAVEMGNHFHDMRAEYQTMQNGGNSRRRIERCFWLIRRNPGGSTGEGPVWRRRSGGIRAG